jgi:hypothetical protein
MKMRVLALVLLLSVSCSSKKHQELKEQEHKNLMPDYVVRDSNSHYRAGWIEDAQEWARQNLSDTQEFRYFAYETEPKVTREMACSLARSYTKSQIAGEIQSFIELTLSSSVEGKAAIDPENPQTKPLRDYVEETLVEKIVALVHGAQISRLYWEKRDYQKKLGARADYTGFVCAALIKMPKDLLEKAIRQASQTVINQASSQEQKAQLQKALEGAEKNFEKAKQGLI